MFFFTEPEKITQQTPAYGRVDANIYQLTTHFSLAADAKAFACQDGQIGFLPSSDPTRLNVILKPNSPLQIPFPSPRYYIYRGILKSSILASDTEILPPGAGNSEFLRLFWHNVDIWRGVFPVTETPGPTRLGYLDFLDDSTNVERIFTLGETPGAGELPALNRIKEGVWFGNFGSEGGIEIITDNEDLLLNIGYMKERDVKVDLTGVLTTTPEQLLERRLLREEILNYIDPAAFFGMYHNRGVHIFDATTSDKKRLIIGPLIYESIITKFSTKNRVYLDIRSEKGYSYNFYQNYGNATGKNLRFKIPADTNFREVDFDADWPIFAHDVGRNEVIAFSKFIIQLRVDDNISPILFFEDDLIADKSVPKFVDHFKLRNGAATDWTKDIVLKFRNVEDSTVPSRPRVYMANYLRIQYFRQMENLGPPATVLTNGNLPDNVFGGIGDFVMNYNSVLRVYRNTKKIFIQGSDFGYVAETGLYYNDKRVVMYAKSLYAYKTSGKLWPVIRQDLTGPALVNSPSFPKKIVFNRWTLDLAPDDVHITEIAGYTENSSATPKEHLFLMGITRGEFESMIVQPGFVRYHGKYVAFVKDPAVSEDLSKQKYSVYDVKLQGLTPSGNRLIVPTAPSLKVFSSSSNMYCSESFSKQSEIPLGVQDPVTLNNEFPLSSKWEMTVAEANRLHAGSGSLSVRDLYLETIDKPNPHEDTRRVEMRSITFFPAGTAVGPFPLIVIVPGNNQLYGNYQGICEHLALNGFIAASIDCRYVPHPSIPMADVTLPDLLTKGYTKQISLWGDPYVFKPAATGPGTLDALVKVEGGIASTKPTNFVEGNHYTINLATNTFLIRPDPSHGMGTIGRALLIPEHLKLLAAQFGANLDKSKVGLMGHSRGGEAVFKAATEIASALGFNIAAIMALAPTDNLPYKDPAQKFRIDFAKNIPTFHLYGSRDGDTSGYQPFAGLPRGTAFTLYDRTKNNSMKAMAFVNKATHNGFNTTNNDYDKVTSRLPDQAKLLLDPVVQKHIFFGYSNAFFRMTLRDEPKWKIMFTGEWIPPSLVAGGHQGIYMQYQARQGEYTTLAEFEGQDLSSPTHDDDVKIAALRLVPENRQQTGTTGDVSLNSFSPHSTNGAKVEWTNKKKWIFTFPPGTIGTHTDLSFRIAAYPGVDQGKVLSGIQVVMGASKPVQIKTLIPDVDIRPDLALPKFEWNEKLNTKSAMMTIRIPLSSFVALGVDLSLAKEIAFIFPGSGGRADIDSIQFTK